MRKAWPFLVLSFFPLLLLAEVVPTDPDTVPIFDFVKMIFDVKWKELGVWGIVSTILTLLVAATKVPSLGGFFDKLGPVGKRLLVLGFSTLLVGTTVLAAGGSLSAAVAAVLGSSAGAVFFHEMWKPVLELIKKLFGKGESQ